MENGMTGYAGTLGATPWWSAAGFGAYGGSFGRFADDSSNAVRINCNREVVGLGLDRISDQNEETRRNLGEARVMDNITASCNRVADNQVNGEFRMSDRLRDLEREMTANARVAAECCCDLKLENCKNTALLQAEIKAVEGRTIERELNAAQARVTQLETINAITQACGCCPSPSTVSR